MTEIDRGRLIADLEAHYGRWLRHCVMVDHESAVNMAERYPDRVASLAKHVEWTQAQYDIAKEAHEIILAAREMTDDGLDILVRWKTLPKWREAMQAAGYEFDEVHGIWTETPPQIMKPSTI